jgi:hypothetical protein
MLNTSWFMVHGQSAGNKSLMLRVDIICGPSSVTPIPVNPTNPNHDSSAHPFFASAVRSPTPRNKNPIKPIKESLPYERSLSVLERSLSGFELEA